MLGEMTGKDQKNQPSLVLAAYMLFTFGSLIVYHFVANGEFSSILTMAQMIQCLAFVLLVIKSCSQGSVAGISGKSLALEALAFVCRLSSTTWLNGYLPVDASGDFIYQAVDLCSLLLVLSLLYRAYLSHRWSYEEEADSLPVLPMIAVCFLLAALLHADMNSRPLFVYKIQNAPSYYDSRIRGKVQRLDKPRIAPHLSQRSKAGAPRPPKEARKGKEVWNFKDEDFEPLRHLWREYIQDLKIDIEDPGAGTAGTAGSESLFESIDLHGACVEVVAAKQPNLLRLKGTVIEETQRTLRIINSQNEVKMIPKDACVFEVELPPCRLRFLGPCHGRPGLPSRGWRL